MTLKTIGFKGAWQKNCKRMFSLQLNLVSFMVEEQRKEFGCQCFSICPPALSPVLEAEHGDRFTVWAILPCHSAEQTVTGSCSWGDGAFMLEEWWTSRYMPFAIKEMQCIPNRGYGLRCYGFGKYHFTLSLLFNVKNCTKIWSMNNDAFKNWKLLSILRFGIDLHSS